MQYFEYQIQGGDTLSKIIGDMYGVHRGDQQYAKSVEYILSINPHIKNPDQIRAGEVVRLGVIPATQLPKSSQPAQNKPIPGGKTLTTKTVPQQDWKNYWVLAWLEHNSNLLTIPGAVGLGATSNLMSPGNKALITETSDLYAQYKSGSITKGQYDYRRAKALDRLRANLGPTEKWLFGNKTTHESIRIAKRGGIPVTAHISRHADRISRIAKYARNGGIVLTGVGLTASCMQIANTKSRAEKNEIFVETIGSTLTGVLGGAAIGIFLVSNPIGWGAALVLAVGSTAVSYGAGKVARSAYTASGSKVDFVSGTGVYTICR